mgnify:CR=1 FL=1
MSSRNLLYFWMMILIISSCASAKNITYFQNRAVNHPEKIDKHAGIVIQPKDMLSIVVSSRNPELVAMFNLPVVSYQAGSEVVTGGYNQRLQQMGVLFQLNIPSLTGFYGKEIRVRAEHLLREGMYSVSGSDCHSIKAIRFQYSDAILSQDILKRIPLLDNII